MQFHLGSIAQPTKLCFMALRSCFEPKDLSRDAVSSRGFHPKPLNLPLVSREWKNGSNSTCYCTPFLHSLLTKGKQTLNPKLRESQCCQGENAESVSAGLQVRC